MTGNEPRPERPGDQPPTTQGDPEPPVRPDDQRHSPGEAVEQERREPTSAAADSPRPGYPPSGHAQTDYETPGYTESGYAQPGYTQPGYPQSGYTQPGYPQSGYAQPGSPGSGYTQPGYQQPGYTQPGYPTAGYPQYPYPQPGYQQPGYTGGYTVYPYPPPYQVPRTDDGPRTLAIAALVSNIAVSLLCCPLVGIAGIVLSTMALSRSERDPDSARKLITWSWAALAAAIVTGITAFVLLFALSPDG